MMWQEEIFGGDRVEVHIRDSDEAATFTVREAHFPWGRTSGKYLVAPSGQIYSENNTNADVVESALIPWEPGVTIRASIDFESVILPDDSELLEDKTFLDCLLGYHTLGPVGRRPNRWGTTIETSTGSRVPWDFDVREIVQWRFLTLTDRVAKRLAKEAAFRASEGNLMLPRYIEDTIPNRVSFALISMFGGRRDGAEFDPYFQ
ncbi:hypothetical protein E3O25_10920 [Cryobacterium sp. TMT1-3]|uniref:Uncharacterized protein n=1 Tax=Cryobacterium luteum TaxID=1424661 RepID=A0A1H8F587_9MICO|nr:MULTISPECIES: hypothetical protein [Cryobacterium]TFB85515.1 hypothetical protein E3O10_15405 [Cryobacterium luteum]TFC26580.1 hypothetical protein E3O25_10920 [Cryobacterium sp. TMT1-3]SEN26953.1 hypothetical protein SAMN05216281_105193 [Cryobacterium luteum]